MKKKFLILLSVLFVFGAVAASFAYNRTNSASTTSASCPMHKQTANGENKDSCCGNDNCCKDGKCAMGGACCRDNGSCPMKKSAETKSANDINMSKVIIVGGESSGDDCCQPGADCCKGGSACCHKKS